MDTSHFGHHLIMVTLLLIGTPLLQSAPLIDTPLESNLETYEQQQTLDDLADLVNSPQGQMHRQQRSAGQRSTPNLYVSVEVNAEPETIVLHPGQTIQVRCAAQAALTVNDFLYVSFYRQFGETTHMPLSSGDVGVMVEPAVWTQSDFDHDSFHDVDNPDLVKSVKVLTLGPEAYETLDAGRNLFYCKAASKSGERQVSYFLVKRAPAQRPRGFNPRFRRWTPPPRH